MTLCSCSRRCQVFSRPAAPCPWLAWLALSSNMALYRSQISHFKVVIARLATILPFAKASAARVHTNIQPAPVRGPQVPAPRPPPHNPPSGSTRTPIWHAVSRCCFGFDRGRASKLDYRIRLRKPLRDATSVLAVRALRLQAS